MDCSSWVQAVPSRKPQGIHLVLAALLVLLSAASACAAGFAVTSVTPAHGSVDVAVGENVIVKFSGPIDQASLTADSVLVNDKTLKEWEGGGLAFPEEDSAVILFRMKSDQVYRIVLKAAIRGTDGTALPREFSWRFATTSRVGAPGDPVRVFARYPRFNDMTVPTNAPVTMTFTAEMAPDSVSDGSILLIPQPDGKPVAGRITVRGMRAVFRPEKPLQPNRTYEVQVAAGVMSASGEMMERPGVWQFTTGDGPAEGPVITDCWYESHQDKDGLRLVFHASVENLVKPGKNGDAPEKPAVSPAAPGVLAEGHALKAAFISLEAISPSQPLSTPSDLSAKDMPVTTGPTTVVTAAYTHGGGAGQCNSVAGSTWKDPVQEKIEAALDSALSGGKASVLQDTGDVIRHGDRAKGDGVYSARLTVDRGFPAGQALMAFSMAAPDGTKTDPVTTGYYVVPTAESGQLLTSGDRPESGSPAPGSPENAR